MRKKITLITGASGEIGQALIKNLKENSDLPVVTLDLNPLPDEVQAMVTALQGDILDKALLARLVSEYEIETIYHLAALLSTRSEFTPETAHRVNVEGSLGLLQLAAEQSAWRGEPVKFIFPSSIAAYGLPDLETKNKDTHVREWDWNTPRTMYGCNKLYCEMLGTYFSDYYRQLAPEKSVMLDFRSLRFPGLISAFTVPSGGTSDYGPEMLHHAAQNKPYACFVREDVRIPFMAMPDAVKALLLLTSAKRENLKRHVYNITAFSLSAVEFRDWVLKFFPNAQVTFQPDLKRQAIVDSWPGDLDDSAAQQDWGWSPDYGVERSFKEYLVPNIRARYQGSKMPRTIE
ncbi:MAG TPA: NAD-dependent epimerase/dehydratase family protein [Anaerolineales bacterium]|nr:NAD-dependent epimerase/dehydratase family protein [Anaerolineales bacterium]